MLGIGNEQWGPQYIERYERFAKTIKQEHPQIKLIAAAGPSPDGAEFEFAWEKFGALEADIIDEHYYRPPEWFIANANRYDTYERTGPKVFAGEFAAQSVGVASPLNRNNWNCALAEAAFMTGLERNADVVSMACYAPLLAHIDGWQWTPNLIWFDNLRSFGTPSYYVQKLFGQHCGTVSLPIEIDGEVKGLFTCAARDAEGDLVLKLVNVEAMPSRVTVFWKGLTQPATGESRVLAARPEAENTLDEPMRVSPFTTLLRHVEPKSDYFLPPHSLTVLRIKSSNRP
jgi:alpha-N-arabinofuranosidase